MSACRVCLAAAFVFLIPATATAQGFQYAASTGQYRVTTTVKTVQEAMGQRQESDGRNDQLLTLTVARAAKDTLSFTVVIDSFSITGGRGMTPPGLEKLIGVRIVAKMSPSGTVYSAEGPAAGEVPNAAALTKELARVLPKIKATLARGAAWTDTTADTTRQNGLDINRVVIGKYVVTGDTTVGGEKAWLLTHESAMTMSGSGAPGGQPMALEATGTGKGTVLISHKGVFVGGNTEEESSTKVVMAANGMEVGVTSSTITKVEKVK